MFDRSYSKIHRAVHQQDKFSMTAKYVQNYLGGYTYSSSEITMMSTPETKSSASWSVATRGTYSLSEMTTMSMPKPETNLSVSWSLAVRGTYSSSEMTTMSTPEPETKS